MLNIEQQQQRVVFSGVLDRNTLLTFWPFRLLSRLSGDVVFDFSQVQSIETAGRAWV